MVHLLSTLTTPTGLDSVTVVTNVGMTVRHAVRTATRHSSRDAGLGSRLAPRCCSPAGGRETLGHTMLSTQAGQWWCLHSGGRQTSRAAPQDEHRMRQTATDTVPDITAHRCVSLSLLSHLSSSSGTGSVNTWGLGLPGDWHPTHGC